MVLVDITEANMKCGRIKTTNRYHDVDKVHEVFRKLLDFFMANSTNKSASCGKKVIKMASCANMPLFTHNRKSVYCDRRMQFR